MMSTLPLFYMMLRVNMGAQGEATGRAIRLAAHINTPLYVVHVMSKDALDEVVSARAAGHRVIGEAVASGIALTDAGL